jgi:hypothetical protein
MNLDTAIQHVKSAIEQVADDNDIPESVYHASLKDEQFIDNAAARLIRSLPADLAAGDPDFDLAAAAFSEALQPEALKLLERYQAKDR